MCVESEDVLGGVLIELPHEGHDVGGECARGLGDEEVDDAAALEGVAVVAAVLFDAPDACGAVERSTVPALWRRPRVLLISSSKVLPHAKKPPPRRLRDGSSRGRGRACST